MIGIYIGLGAIALVLLVFLCGYLKAPPDQAYIISGLGKKRILVGKAGWHLPFFERVDKLSLQVMQIDIKTSEAILNGFSRQERTMPTTKVTRFRIWRSIGSARLMRTCMSHLCIGMK